MLHKMFHALYRWLLRLHPRVFRERFSEEMMWIFEEARATHGTARLFADGVISLLRQWATRQESWKSRMMMIAARSGTGFSMALLSWEYWELPEQRLPVRRWMQGGIISEEHTSELQSQSNLVCRLLLEKKKNIIVVAHAFRLNVSRDNLFRISPQSQRQL